MAVDYTLKWECEPRMHFGEGDAVQGAVTVLDMLKAHDRAHTASELMRQEGKDPATESITIRRVNPDGSMEDQEVTIAEMEAQAEPLKDWESHCAGCPANLSGIPYGCHGFVRYPIPQAAEEWLIAQLQPFNTIGNELCRMFVQQLGVTGDHVRGLRARGFSEAKSGLSISRKTGLLRRESISTDQLLQALFYTNTALDPLLCQGLLSWFGAIALDGAVPKEIAEAEKVKAIKELAGPDERKARTSFALEVPTTDAAHYELAVFLHAMYLAWVYEAMLLVDA